MSTQPMQTRSYRTLRLDEQVPAKATERYRTLRAYRQLCDTSCGEALVRLGISRRALYQ